MHPYLVFVVLIEIKPSLHTVRLKLTSNFITIIHNGKKMQLPLDLVIMIETKPFQNPPPLD